MEEKETRKRRRPDRFETGEFRKFLLAIFASLCNICIFLVAMLQPDKTEITFIAVTFAISMETLVLQYYFRKKSPAE